MAVVLAVLTGSDDDASVLDHAAATFGGSHIQVLHVRRDPREAIPLVGEGLSPDLVQRMLDEAARDSDRRSTRAHAAFDDWCHRSEVAIRSVPDGTAAPTAEWIETTGRGEDIGRTFGRFADLIVMAAPNSGGDQGSIEAALFDSGHPVLLVPGSTPVTTGDAAVFWNGSAEAARAVGAALPVLARCGMVHILRIKDGTDAEAPEPELTAYLAWHGISALVRTLAPDYREPGEALLEEAGRVGATLVVMGAYTHSRMRQMILGGVTSHVLGHAPVPILLAH